MSDLNVMCFVKFLVPTLHYICVLELCAGRAADNSWAPPPILYGRHAAAVNLLARLRCRTGVFKCFASFLIFLYDLVKFLSMK